MDQLLFTEVCLEMAYLDFLGSGSLASLLPPCCLHSVGGTRREVVTRLKIVEKCTIFIQFIESMIAFMKIFMLDPSTCSFYLSRTVIMIDLRPLRSDDTHRSERSWPSETDEMLTGKDELGLEGLLDSPFCLFLSISLQSSRQVNKHSLLGTKSAFWTVHLSKCQSVTELTTAGPTCAGLCLRTGCFN